ncbi:unnamed protein product, partial [Gulo gulo]
SLHFYDLVLSSVLPGPWRALQESSEKVYFSTDKLYVSYKTEIGTK